MVVKDLGLIFREEYYGKLQYRIAFHSVLCCVGFLPPHAVYGRAEICGQKRDNWHLHTGVAPAHGHGTCKRVWHLHTGMALANA